MRYSRLLATILAGAALAPAPRASAQDPPAPPDTLTVDVAVSLAVAHNPSLRAAGFRRDAAQSRIDQAGRRPNPGLSFEMENVGGTYAGLGSTEYTLALAQPLEVGGKRSARTEAARASAAGSDLDRERTEFLVACEARRRFQAVVAAEARLQLLRDNARLAAEIARVAGERASAGAALMSDAALSRGSALEAEFAVREGEVATRAARRSLALLWGADDGFTGAVAGGLALPATLPPTDSLVARVADSPDVRRARSDATLARAEERMARSLGVPDVVALGGVRRVAEDDATTFLVGVQLPLPLFDRNQGGIAAAAGRVRSADAVADSVRAALASALREQRDALAQLLERHRLIDAELIPVQTAALDVMRRGYEMGRVSAPDLLEARGRLVALGLERSHTQLRIAEQTIAIEAALGVPWNRIAQEQGAEHE